MLHSYSLHTSEIDDIDAAIGDITGQLRNITLLGNAVGILVCHYDFVTSGIVAALSEMLPFPLVGITSFYQAAPQVNGHFELTITLLTSDDVRFAVANSVGEGTDIPPSEVVADAYWRAFAVYGEQPSLIFGFLSANRPISGDAFLRMLDASSGGVPSFGGVTTGDDEAGTNVFIINQGYISTYGFALLLLIGDVNISFYAGNYRDDKMLEMIATVTKADDVIVQELNEQPAVAYLREHGFPLEDTECNTISNIPFLYKEAGEPLFTARTLGGFDMAGGLHFLGAIPQGARLRIGNTSNEDILEISREVTEQAVAENPRASALFVFSCVGRYIALGLSPTSELEYVAQGIPGNIPYLACYVGGEICPILSDEHLANRYHNASFVVCALS